MERMAGLFLVWRTWLSYKTALYGGITVLNLSQTGSGNVAREFTRDLHKIGIIH